MLSILFLLNVGKGRLEAHNRIYLLNARRKTGLIWVAGYHGDSWRHTRYLNSYSVQDRSELQKTNIRFRSILQVWIVRIKWLMGDVDGVKSRNWCGVVSIVNPGLSFLCKGGNSKAGSVACARWRCAI